MPRLGRRQPNRPIILRGRAAPAGGLQTVVRNQISTFTSVPNNANNVVTTFGTQPLVGSKIILGVFESAGATPTSVTDNASPPNTYVLDLGPAIQNNERFFIYRADNISLPSSGNLAVTTTWAANGFFSAQAITYTGLAAGGPTATNNHVSAGAQSSWDSNAAGGASTGLHFVVMVSDNTGTANIVFTAPFTVRGVQQNGSSDMTGGIGDQINALASQTCNGTLANAQWFAGIAAYDAAPAGGGPTTVWVPGVIGQYGGSF